MSQKKKETEDFFLPETTKEDYEVYNLTPAEKENLHHLLEDVVLDITDPVYAPIRSKLILYLSLAYKDHEIQGELALTQNEFATFRAHVPHDLWERARTESARFAGRKRAEKLSKEGSHDMDILRALDPAFSPRQINLNIDPQELALSDEEKEKIALLFPTPTRKIIDIPSE